MDIIIPSKYVKANINIHAGDIVQLKNEGKYVPTEIKGEKKTLLVFQIELPNKEIKEYNMNVTTQKVLIKAWGKDSKEWVGKDLKVWIEKQLSFGKKIDVMVLSPADAGDPFVEEDEEELETIQTEETPTF